MARNSLVAGPCSYCGDPLYREEPVIVTDCPGHRTFGCPEACRPDFCLPVGATLAHVGCHVYARRTDL